MTSPVEAVPLDHVWRTSIGDSPLVTIDLGPLPRPRRARSPRLTSRRAASSPDGVSSVRPATRCSWSNSGPPTSAAKAAVPGSVQSLVQARMDQLDPFDKQALQTAAIFGQRFVLDALRHALESPDYACAALVEHFLVRPVGDDFLFAHALIRDAVYDTLLGPDAASCIGRPRTGSRRAIWFFAPSISTGPRVPRRRMPIWKRPAPRPPTTGTSAPVADRARSGARCQCRGSLRAHPPARRDPPRPRCDGRIAGRRPAGGSSSLETTASARRRGSASRR